VTGHWPPTPISVLTPVELGQEGRLRRHLDRIRVTPQRPSPFARLDSVHMARLVVVGQVKPYAGIPAPKRPLSMRYLLFSVVANRAPDPFFEELCRACGREADGIWGHCLGYPGSANDEDFGHYMRRHLLPAQQQFKAFDATPGQIKAALELRERHAEFAMAAQHIKTPARLQLAFLRWEAGDRP
jgi:hypothetical protein